MTEKNNKNKNFTISAIIIVAIMGVCFGKMGAFGAAAVFVAIILLVNDKEENEMDTARVIESRLRLSDLRLPANLPFPYAVFSETGNILFYNGEFEELVGDNVPKKNEPPPYILQCDRDSKPNGHLGEITNDAENLRHLIKT